MIDKKYWRPKIYAALIHLAVSFLFAAIVAWLIYRVWYPAPYREVLWGQSIYKLLIGVDVILGPLITLIVFNKKKSLFERSLDIGVIVILQLSALGYGLWVMAQARPAQIVFEYDHFQIVPVYLIPMPQPGEKVTHQIEWEPWTGPNLISLRHSPLDEENIKKWKKEIQFGGSPLAARPVLWQPYKDAHGAVLNASIPVKELLEKFPLEKSRINSAIEKTGIHEEELTYIPIYAGKLAGAVLLKKGTSDILSVVHIKSMPVPSKYGVPENFN